MDTTRRCVLPPEHEGDHVYPPQQPLSSQVDIT